MNVLDLFSGIGGFSLGLERAGGFKTAAFCEQAAYPQSVLAKHWPEVPCYDDVRNLSAAKLHEDGVAVDVMCGGFPCQDISYAGPGGGLSGARSGLWWEYARLIGELGPSYVIVENVAALLARGLGHILGTLSDLGYDAEWDVVTACAMGAPHMRRRVFIVAYADRIHGRPWLRNSHARQDWTLQALDGFAGARAGWAARLENPSKLYRGADGVPNGMDRNHAIGNSVVPNVVEFIGRRIMAVDAQSALMAA